MKKIRYIPLLILFELSILFVNAQDPYYSQYFMSPMTSNPGLIGKGVADMRLLSNIRSQTWGSGSDVAFKTTSVSFEQSIARNRLSEDQFGIGLSFVNDASNNGLINRNFISLGAAFNKTLSQYSTFGVGIAANYANMLLNPSQFTFQNQFGSMGFIRTIPSYEPMLVNNKTYFNADGGIHYSYEDSVWGFNIGSSIYHAAQNRQGAFTNSNFNFLPRYSTRASVLRKFLGGDELHVLTSFDKQGINNIFTYGSIYKLNIPGEHPISRLSLGIFNRIGDSFYPYVGFESSTWIAGLTYDIVNSDVRTYYNSVQSIEFSFGWLFNSKKSKSKNPVRKRTIIY
jgi:type IX secretion system PorP/SprF family membrane protein